MSLVSSAHVCLGIFAFYFLGLLCPFNPPPFWIPADLLSKLYGDPQYLESQKALVSGLALMVDEGRL
jgi:hypothetical protein